MSLEFHDCKYLLWIFIWFYLTVWQTSKCYKINHSRIFLGVLLCTQVNLLDRSLSFPLPLLLSVLDVLIARFLWSFWRRNFIFETVRNSCLRFPHWHSCSNRITVLWSIILCLYFTTNRWVWITRFLFHLWGGVKK